MTLQNDDNIVVWCDVRKKREGRVQKSFKVKGDMLVNVFKKRVASKFWQLF